MKKDKLPKIQTIQKGAETLVEQASNLASRAYTFMQLQLAKIYASIPQTATFMAPALDIFSAVLTLFSYVCLVLHTAHVLASTEKRYINLRHLLLKWIVIVFGLEVISGWEVQYAIAAKILLCGIAMPTKLIRTLHMKYFSHSDKKKYDQSLNDPSSYDASFVERCLIKVILFFMDSSKFILAFVHPNHRKKIEEANRQISSFIAEEKYFWRMYEVGRAQPKVEGHVSTREASAITRDDRMTTRIPTQGSTRSPDSKLSVSNPMKESLRLSERPTKQPSVVRYRVEQLLNIRPDGEQESIRLSFYRVVDLIYHVDTLELTILADDKSNTYTLIEFGIVEELTLQLLFEEEEEIFIKFRNKREMESFIASTRNNNA